MILITDFSLHLKNQVTKEIFYVKFEEGERENLKCLDSLSDGVSLMARQG